MEKASIFDDLDNELVYNESQKRVLQQSTRNFVVEFGKNAAHVAFDIHAEDVHNLPADSSHTERPIRWINIWAPNKQTDLVDYLGKHYKFSPRLLAIILSAPPETLPVPIEKLGHRSRIFGHKDDVEARTASVETTRNSSLRATAADQTSHYALAKQMTNYQSIDVGAHFLCIGANWMHELPSSLHDDNRSIIDEGSQTRLWSWLILCDDNTVISLHEDPGPYVKTEDISALRANTISVFSQLSKFGHEQADPISMQTVRQALEIDPTQANSGTEGASNLFFYLFDDWRAVYKTVATFRKRLFDLQNEIFNDLSRRSNSAPRIKIIPRLHILGRQIRQMEHLYEGYKKLIERILERKSATTIQAAGTTTPEITRSFSGISSTFGLGSSRGVYLATSASQRFERLGDRIELLILSECREFLLEKEALISTYFNINAQKDSEATARLTRSATLLAKLSVLFVPVSLLTSYFSIQVEDLQGVYTVRDYWSAFAVLMGVSFLGLFFFGRALMWCTEVVDEWAKTVVAAVRRMVFRKRRREEVVREGGESELAKME